MSNSGGGGWMESPREKVPKSGSPFPAQQREVTSGLEFSVRHPVPLSRDLLEQVQRG